MATVFLSGVSLLIHLPHSLPGHYRRRSHSVFNFRVFTDKVCQCCQNQYIIAQWLTARSTWCLLPVTSHCHDYESANCLYGLPYSFIISYLYIWTYIMGIDFTEETVLHSNKSKLMSTNNKNDRLWHSCSMNIVQPMKMVHLESARQCRWISLT